MEYQKIPNLLNAESNQPSKFRTRNWVEINGEARGTYSPNKQIKCKTSMLRSSLCDITVVNTAAEGAAANNTNRKVLFKTCAPFAN